MELGLYLLVFIIAYLLGGAMAMKWFNQDIKTGVIKDKNGVLYTLKKVKPDETT